MQLTCWPNLQYWWGLQLFSSPRKYIFPIWSSSFIYYINILQFAWCVTGIYYITVREICLVTPVQNWSKLWVPNAVAGWLYLSWGNKYRFHFEPNYQFWICFALFCFLSNVENSYINIGLVYDTKKKKPPLTWTQVITEKNNKPILLRVFVITTAFQVHYTKKNWLLMGSLLGGGS